MHPPLLGGVTLIMAAMVLNAHTYLKIAASGQQVSAKGLLLSAGQGMLIGSFNKYVAASVFPGFYMPLDGKLSTFTAIVFSF